MSEEREKDTVPDEAPGVEMPAPPDDQEPPPSVPETQRRPDPERPGRRGG
jgi:hypothetical protein